MIIKATDKHRSFVLATWVRSFIEASELDKSILHLHEPKRAEDNFAAGNVWVDTSDGYTVNGWVCGIPEFLEGGNTWKYGLQIPAVLHWVYVPPELRGLGVATKLILETLGDKPEVSAWQKVKRFRTKLPLGKLNPYRLMEL